MTQHGIDDNWLVCDECGEWHNPANGIICNQCGNCVDLEWTNARMNDADELITILTEALTDAKLRLAPFAKCWKEETTMEEAITLDDLALASAWLDQYAELLAQVKHVD